MGDQIVSRFNYLDVEEDCCDEVFSNLEEGARPMWCIQPSIEER